MKANDVADLLGLLEARFGRYPARHPGIAWAAVRARLEARPDALRVLQAMEETGGEPDVIAMRADSGEYRYCDCAAESPVGRRSSCYDRDAQDGRKEHRPAHNAVDMAASIGIELLSEQGYRDLQALGVFDAKTSSWVETPADVRRLGGALFCDRRYGRIFTYHNGAQSYYASRGFRGAFWV